MLFTSCGAQKFASEKGLEKNCESKFHKVLNRKAYLLIENKGGVYTFDHEKVNPPKNWNNKKWDFGLGKIGVLEITGSKYLEFMQSLLDMENEIKNSLCTITDKDFETHFKKPTSTVVKDEEIIFFYMFNNKSYPDCYRENAPEQEQYFNCRMFGVSFDLNGNLKKIHPMTFAYQ